MSEKIVLLPEFNHGRWIVKCPDCNGAETYERKGAQVFYCLSEHGLWQTGQAENPPPKYRVAGGSQATQKREYESVTWRICSRP